MDLKDCFRGWLADDSLACTNGIAQVNFRNQLLSVKIALLKKPAYFEFIRFFQILTAVETQCHSGRHHRAGRQVFAG